MRRAVVMLAGTAVLCGFAAVVADPLWAGSAAFAAILLLNYTPLWKVIPSALVRRVIRAAPLVAPLTHWHLPDEPGRVWTWVACLLPVLIRHGMRWPQIATALRSARLFPPVGPGDRAAAVFLFTASGPAQEYLYRGILLAATAAYVGPAAIALTTLAFVAEHVMTRNPHARRDPRDIVLWVTLSFLYGGVVYVEPAALWPAMIGHLLLNLPNVLQWMRVPAPALTATGASR